MRRFRSVRFSLGNLRTLLSAVCRHDRRIDGYLVLCSLTLSPALCAVLFKDHDPQGTSSYGLVGSFSHSGFGWFNRGFESLSNGYGNLTRRLVAGVAIVLAIYVALIGVAGLEFSRAQTGFIPEQDQGYLITIVQLPRRDARTDRGGSEAGDRYHPQHTRR